MFALHLIKWRNFSSFNDAIVLLNTKNLHTIDRYKVQLKKHSDDDDDSSNERKKEETMISCH